MSDRFDQTFIEASDGAGYTKQFFYTPAEFLAAGAAGTPYETALERAQKYAQSSGYVVLMGRNRLNDYVGSPIWSSARVIEEL